MRQMRQNCRARIGRKTRRKKKPLLVEGPRLNYSVMGIPFQ
jgi:hypothetical protein